MTPALWLERAARLHPDAPALFEGETCVRDYAGFAAAAASLSATLQRRHGLKPDDRVALFLPNSTIYLELLYAIWHAGGVVVPINHKLHPQEAAWMIADCEARVVFAVGDAARSLREGTASVVIDIESDAFEDLRTTPPVPPVARAADDLAWLFYTSGTTGRPKGVMLSNANLLAATQSYFVDVDAVTSEDTAYYAAPMSHGAGLYNFAFVMRAARHVVPATAGFDVAEVAQMAAHHGNLSMFAAPTMVRRLISAAAKSGYDGTGIKTIVYGGGPMYLADILDAVDAFGPRFVQIYGQGESPMTITALSRETVADRVHPRWKERLASVGMPHSAVSVRVADAQGAELPRGDVGEILVAGPPVMQGYWRNAEATADALRDGWLWTGDMGTMDADGFVTLTDRSKDVVISGGSNIYPREVEEALLTHGSVAQVCVVGAPDPEWGESVVAFVVLQEGQSKDEAALDAHCRGQMAAFKRPKRYVFVETLPVNAYGKVLKTELRAQLRS